MARCFSRFFLLISIVRLFSKLSLFSKNVYSRMFSLKSLSQLIPLIASSTIVIGTYLMFTSAASRLTCEQQLRLSLKESRYRLRGETVHSKDDSQALLPGEYNMHQPPPSQNNFDGDSHLQVHEDLFKYAASALYEKEYPNVENYIQYATARLRLKQLKGVMPLRPEFGTVVNDVTSFEFSLNKEQCAIAKSNRTMFVAICSASTSIAKRASIRETWLKQIQSHADAEGLGIVGVRFVIARPQEASVQEQLELESKKYSDILQVDIMETNKNLLTLKGIALLNWVHSYCSNATLLLKVHDHVFVNTRVLIQNFARINDNGPVVYGRLVSDLVNKEDSKLGRDEWPWKSYPSHLSGLITIMTSESISATLAASQVVPPVSLEDIYITGLCSEKAEVILMVSDRMAATSGVNDFPDPCQVRLSLGWLTRSVEHYSNSHIAAENFYNGRTQCILPYTIGSQQSADPSEVVAISFNQIKQ